MMSNTLARAFILARMDNGQVSALHEREKKDGELMMPYWIHEHFQTRAWGDLPEEKQLAVSKTVYYFYGQAENRAKHREEFPSVQDFHWADWEIRNKNLPFESSCGSERERIRNRNYED